ncbi:hypothetical protein L7F22_020246 [Adiantum nelumboides]|nr:hypothetical protein [Adiantum nelumboides]
MKDSDGTSGYLSDSASSSVESKGSRGIFSAYARRSAGDLEHLERMDFKNPIGEAALPRMAVPVFAMDDRAQKSAPNSRLTSPVSSPKALASHGQRILQKNAPNNTFASPDSSPRAWGFATNYLQQLCSPTSSSSNKLLFQQRWLNMNGNGMAHIKTVTSHQSLSNGEAQSKSSCTDAHPLPLPPTFGMNLSSPPSSASCMVTSQGSSIP